MEPKIRFKGFSGIWNSLDLISTFDYIPNNTFSRKDLSINGIVKNIHYGDILVKFDEILNISEAQLPAISYISSTSRPLQNGDIVMADTAEDETVGKAVEIVDIQDNLVEAGLHTYALRPNTSFARGFLGYYINSPAFHDQLLPLIQGTKVCSISKKALSFLSLFVPSKNAEQQAIASYFQAIDAQISSSKSRLASLKQIKVASLQSMFPQEGETVPKVRFKGFEGEWKKKCFADITYESGIKNRENLPLESYSISNEYGFIPQSEQFENGGSMAQADKRMYYIVSPNTFAYNPARINVGSLGYYTSDQNSGKDVIVSSLYEVFKTTPDIDDLFLLYWFKTDAFKRLIEIYQEGGVRLYFFYDKLCQCETLFPSLLEQQAIASFFRSLDRKISLETARLEKLKQIKAACLDKMFV